MLITLATQRTTHLIGAGHAVPQALTEGFRLAYLIGAVLCAAAAVFTFVTVPRPAVGQGPATRLVPLAVGVAVVIGAFIVVDFAFGGSHGAPIGEYTTGSNTYSFVSQPSLHPPIARADVVPNEDQLPQGDIFVANFYDLTKPPIVGQSGPLIYDNHLSPVWFKPVPEDVVAGNLSLQTYQGKPALSWWQGYLTNTGETVTGEDIVVNQQYQTVATLRGVGGWVPTLHEMVIQGDNAWVTVNKNIPKDLSKYGGAYNGALVDSAVQEYSLSTGKLLYSWDALDHIPLNDSYASLPTNAFPWDAYHVNSIQLVGQGKFLVSMRNTWAAYLVDTTSGKIEWTLGGKHSSFKLGPRADFQWQHDVALHPDSTISMFDDHCCQITGGGTYVDPTGASRGLELKLDQQGHTATLADEYTHGSNFDADYMGSTQPLAGGGAFVGWGSQSNFSMFDKSSKMTLDVVLPRPDITYRATVEQWVGLPQYPPVGAARVKDGKTTVYASWNGATKVASWRILAGPGAGSLTGIGTADRSGFETAITLRQGYKAFQVQALDSGGRVLGTSKPFSAT